MSDSKPCECQTTSLSVLKSSPFPNLLRIIKHFAFQLCRVGFTLLNTLLLPVSLILFLPIYTHRYLTAQLAKVFRPDLGKLMTTLSTNFSTDRLHTHPACFTITCQTFIGSYTLNTYQNSFITRLIEFRFPDGTLRYPEFTQYPFKWMGFFFWKPEANFNIHEHIHTIPQKEDEYFSPKDIHRLLQEFNAKPFAKDKSPWEILLIYNTVPLVGRQTVVLFKIHHGMADGYSILKVLVERIGEVSIEKSSNVKPNYFKRSLLSKLFYWVSFPFRAIHEFSSTGLTVMLEKAYWYAPRANRTHSVIGITKPISISRVKATKNKFGVSFTSVICGLCSLSMKSFMTKEKLPIPDEISCVLPFPMPGHPAKLRNFMSCVTPSLPLGLCASAEATLTETNKIYNGIKKSTSPLFNFIVAKTIGGLYGRLSTAIASTFIPSVLITNFPANFEKNIFCDGIECVDVFFFCGLLNLAGLGFYILTYVDTFTVVVAADSSLMSESQVQQFADFIETELQKLEALPPPSITTTKIGSTSLPVV